MIKPWSISTTVRNPNRIRDFLRVLRNLEGQEWTRNNQRRYQVMLIQYKVYGYGQSQFYNGLSPEHINLMANPDPITYEEAEEILRAKNYVGGGDMRGRQSFNPLEKMGLAYLDSENRIRISSFGNYFLSEDFDLGEVFFKSFIKWHLPNPDTRDFRREDGFNIKPFVATLHLISKVNQKWSDLGNDPHGISKEEFILFVPTLINYEDIEDTAQAIIDLRVALNRPRINRQQYYERYKRDYVEHFLNSTNQALINATLNNLREYTDNIIRYFRLTRYIYIRGGGFYIDLEPRRQIEINRLLESDSGGGLEFENRERYLEYVSDINAPLPWENITNLRSILRMVIANVNELKGRLGESALEVRNYEGFSIQELKSYIEELRAIRKEFQEKRNYIISQDLDRLREYVDILRENIYNMENKPLMLEKYVTLALNALNDALSIRPNYPVGDDNEPTFTAPPGKADIEAYYEGFNSICEVTMLQSREQWYNEGQPVMRHLRDFEDTHTNKEAIGLFIAPRLHQDTINTFWNSVRYEYQGRPQKIIPFTLRQFVEILRLLINLKEAGRTLSHIQLLQLYDNLLNLEGIGNSIEWVNSFNTKLDTWKEEILAHG
jgi:hypothetical protein